MSGSAPVEIRRAGPADAGEIAEVWLASFGATYDFPHAHSDDEVRAWLRDEMLPRSETWVAVEDGVIVGLMILSDDMIEQLYLQPDRLRRGIGSRLVELAKERRPDGLDLYTFEVNASARAFYERHGFVVVWSSDGSRNEEHQPDVRYAWRPDKPNR
jgi:ribosomal protein S18 acetylase RimI-like enzyme